MVEGLKTRRSDCEVSRKSTLFEELDFQSIRTQNPSDTTKKVKIDISGNFFETYEETLSRFPDTLLGDPGQFSGSNGLNLY